MVRRNTGILTGICLILIGLSAGGCVSKRAEPDFGAVNDLAEFDPSFQPGIDHLADLDCTQTSEFWKPEDWILLGLKLTHDDQQSVWFVRISTLPPKTDANGVPLPMRAREFYIPIGMGSIKPRTRFSTAVGRICIETFAQDGTFLQSSVRLAPRPAQLASLMEFCEDLQPVSDEPGVKAAPASPEMIKSMATLAVTLQIIGSCGALEPIREAVREQVLNVPDLLDLILSGLKLKLETHMSPTEMLFMPWLAGGTLGPCEQSRFPVCLAGQTVFNCRMVSGSMVSPYHLTGGMLLLEAVHPDKPQNRLTVRVLAAKK
jgi:hypothetical protein